MATEAQKHRLSQQPHSKESNHDLDRKSLFPSLEKSVFLISKMREKSYP